MNFKRIFLLVCMSIVFGNLRAMNTPHSEPTYQRCKKLLNKRINKNDKNLNAPFDGSGCPLLIELIKGKYNDLIELTLEKQSDINLDERMGWFKVTYLQIAATYNNPQAIEILLNKKTNINSENFDEETPLFIASRKNHLECIKLLILSGADVNKQKYPQKTPLQASITHGTNSISCMCYLLCNNANPNITKIDGSSPLINAIRKKNNNEKKPDELKTLTKLLITFGADITIAARNCGPRNIIAHKTPVRLARALQNTVLANYIENYAQQRDKLFAHVGPKTKFKQLPITSDKTDTTIPRCYIKNIGGNNLMHYALKHHNIKLFNQLLCLRPKMITEPNFAGKAPIDLIPENDDLKMWFVSHLNDEYWMQQPIIDQQ